MANYIPFSTLASDCCRLIGDSQETRLIEVKSVINMVYLTEILCADPLRSMFWLRYLDDSIRAKEPDTIVSISKAAAAVLMTTADTFVTGDIVSFYSVVGMTEMSNRIARLTRTAANTYTLADLSGSLVINTSGYGAAGTGGDVVHRGKVLSNAMKSTIAANWHGYAKSLEPISEKDLELSTYWWGYNLSRPTRFQHLKQFNATGSETDLLLWFCGADTDYQMHLWYELSPPALSADADVPYLPPQFHPLIEAGVVTRLGENKVEVEAGVIWPQIYKLGLASLVDYNRGLWKQYDEQRSPLYLP